MILFKLWSIFSGLILVTAMDTFLIGRMGVNLLTMSIGTVFGVSGFGLGILAILRWIVLPITEMLNVAGQLA